MGSLVFPISVNVIKSEQLENSDMMHSQTKEKGEAKCVNLKMVIIYSEASYGLVHTHCHNPPPYAPHE